MSTEPILLREEHGCVRLTFNRADERNPIGTKFLRTLDSLLDAVERMPETNVLILAAAGDHFSSGMDFREIASAERNEAGAKGAHELCELYYRLIRRLATLPKVVIAEINGKVIAGGVGIVAASDVVIATPESSFALPEILWGIVPAMVLPFLGRRIGSHRAYRLALTSAPMSAAEANGHGLVDHLTNDPQAFARRMIPRLRRLDAIGVGRLKGYVDELESDERVRTLATRTTAALMLDPAVRRKIADFVTRNRLPWEGEGSA